VIKIPLPDWHPEKWQYYEHTKVKHELLRKYLKGWISILGGYHERICYFDCFAGRGEYTKNGETIEGSPIIALKLAKKMKKYYGEFLITLIEKDKDNFENLKQKIEEEGKEDKIHIYFYNASFSEVVGEIMEYLEEKNSQLYPSFFFIDPFGFSDVPSDLVAKILSYRKTEIFFTFMARDINRFLNSEKHENALSMLYWNDEWKKAIRERDRETALVKLYEKQLKEFGNAKYILPFKVCMDQIRQTVYYLIHASNHFKAYKLMKDIAYKQSDGRFGFFGPDDNTRSLLQFRDPVDYIKEYLLENFSGQEIIMSKLMENYYVNTPYIKSDIWRALQKLQEDRIIKITGLGSRGGYRKNAVITIP